MSNSQTITDVACTQCGCVCDDLTITVDGSRIVKAERACSLAEPWYLALGSESPPPASIGDEPVPVETAVARAIEILARSRSPLVYGLSRSSTEGQRAAVALADHLGATIDTTASLCHAPSIMAFQQTGESTSSLGEVRNRSDLVIFWGADPVVSHPRHAERYSVDPVGEFLPGGRADRTVIVIDRRPTASSALADVFIQIEADCDFDALWTLRGLLRGIHPREGARTGAPLSALEDLVQRMKACRSGVAFFGLGLSRRGLGHHNVAALLSLVDELNDYTRFYARRLRLYGDVTGADCVLCWQTGYPFSVNLARGYPRFNPGEFSVDGVLQRRETDACVIVGSETLDQLSPAALEHLLTIPVILLDYPGVRSIVRPAVRFTTAVYGVHRAGTAYRMDEIPIPLKGFLPSAYASDDAILQQVLAQLRSRA
ncbi:MAG: formylmethanofuran dehydrogenase subunit B [Planctomycetia bacterium]|nr:formylmethanofuran dehydrogenase subunit B [Planctomycetia bacterium]